MRPEIVNPPAEVSALASMPVHVVIRDFPEALPVLREEGIDLQGDGALPLNEAGEGAAEVLARTLAWRREA